MLNSKLKILMGVKFSKKGPYPSKYRAFWRCWESVYLETVQIFLGQSITRLLDTSKADCPRDYVGIRTKGAWISIVAINLSSQIS